MSIHAVLNDEADNALKEIGSRLKASNPSLNKFQNALVSLAMVDLRDSLTDAKIKALSEKLLSRASKRKGLETRLATIMQSLDEGSFQSMESGLKKLLNQYEKDHPSPRATTPQRKQDAVIKPSP